MVLGLRDAWTGMVSGGVVVLGRGGARTGVVGGGVVLGLFGLD